MNRQKSFFSFDELLNIQLCLKQRIDKCWFAKIRLTWTRWERITMNRRENLPYQRPSHWIRKRFSRLFDELDQIKKQNPQSNWFLEFSGATCWSLAAEFVSDSRRDRIICYCWCSVTVWRWWNRCWCWIRINRWIQCCSIFTISCLTMRLFRSLIIPILLYGSETWTLLKSDMNKLEVFQMKCLRQILRVSLRDHIRNETIRTRCECQPTIDEQIQKRRLRWFGHVCRMTTNQLPYRLLWRKRPTQWKMERPAPKKTWNKQIEEDLRNQRLSLDNAKITATDRQAWKQLINRIRSPLAPTATYWVRGQPLTTAS